LDTKPAGGFSLLVLFVGLPVYLVLALNVAALVGKVVGTC